jgi:hypothetical protein
LRLVGEYPHPLLRALNRALAESAAFLAHQRRKEERRERRRSLSHLRQKNGQRTIVGDNGELRQHFKNTPLTWGNAIRIIARAVRMRTYDVESRFLAGMLERGVAALRIGTLFVIRLNTGAPFSGSVAPTHSVTLWSTKDNKHPAYRRLRKALRQMRTTVGGGIDSRTDERKARRRLKLLKRFAA